MEVALITGAGSGIGAGVAAALAARGAFVCLCDLDGNAVDRTKISIERSGGRAMAMQVDVTQEEQVADFVKRATEHAGRPTTAVACAGIAAIGHVTDFDAALFRRMIDVNLTGVFLFARHVIRSLRDGGGTFTVVASDAGINGFQGYAAYCASKHGVVGLTKALALDHGPEGVRCNAICPGFVDTPMLDGLLVEMDIDRAQASSAVPLGRLAKVEDVAALVAFVTSAAGSYLNGAMMTLDGGGAAGPYTPA